MKRNFNHKRVNVLIQLTFCSKFNFDFLRCSCNLLDSMTAWSYQPVAAVVLCIVGKSDIYRMYSNDTKMLRVLEGPYL